MNLINELVSAGFPITPFSFYVGYYSEGYSLRVGVAYNTAIHIDKYPQRMHYFKITRFL